MKKTKYFAMGVVGALMFSAPVLAAERASDRDRGPTGASQYSDRDRSKAWNNEKDKLEQALKPGQDKNYYRQQLEKMGYKITSVNYDKPDYVEYEIVKGDDSYEVQIDMENGKASKIDVATNMWKAEATEKALREGRGGSTPQRSAR